MGSTESGGGVKNGGAGSIVWVRRRNGSWWPGKILGHDELSASHLMSPRSGTPVKLLGREDASVDWYNLEKSKRVKAFRCGEFDDCIERAEASFGLPVKKREKYARREDAIIHALELEKQFLEKTIGKVGRANAVREHSSGVLENGNGKLRNHELCQIERTVDISKLIEMKDVSQHIHKVKDDIHPGLNEHDTYVSCQVRDIPSSGLKAVPIKGSPALKAIPINRNFPPLAASEDSNRLFVDGLVHGVSTTGPCFENSSDSDSKISLGKRKQPLESSVDDSFPKRRDRFHSTVKVWQNNVQLHDSSLPSNVQRKGPPVDGVHHSMYFPAELHETFVTNQGNQMEIPIPRLELGPSHSRFGGSAADTTSGSSEETESDSSETHSLEAHVEAGAMISDAETCIRAQPIILDRLQVQVGHESTSSEEYSELPLGDRSEFYFHDQSPAAGVSKWQLKGKRNVRNINKRPVDRFTEGTHFEKRGRSIGQGARIHSFSYYHGNGYANDTDFIEDNFDSHSQGFSKRGYLPSLSQARQNFIGHNMIDSDELAWGRPLRGFWGERGIFNTIYGSTQDGHGLLIDVDLNVQANRQGGEHVPWVSLMSRLNGKAIIGHPVQVETLEDGSTDDVILTSDACDNVSYGINRNKAPPIWSTAKRTANFRVPRPQASSSQLEGSEDDDNEYIQQSGKVHSKKNQNSNLARKSLLINKTLSPHHGAKKSSRRPNSSSSQKTKTLSSIGFNHKFPTKRKNDETSQHIDGVMKSLDPRPPAVACIPVKLVYSRLLEAVGRPPSAPARQGVSVNSNKEEIPIR